jgi:3-hydroxyisobutyrate dehydrogenase-like beta-hydroxyacid dehydrogenase
MKIGILHPGKMGVTIADSIDDKGHSLFWASSDRSPETARRAKLYNLIDLKNINNILSNCDIVFISALNGGPVELANKICSTGYQGIVCDTNNLWGAESYEAMKKQYASAKIDYVEAGIFGWPLDHKLYHDNNHILFLSGKSAETISQVFKKKYWDIKIVLNSAKGEKEKYYLYQ